MFADIRDCSGTILTNNSCILRTSQSLYNGIFIKCGIEESKWLRHPPRCFIPSLNRKLISSIQKNTKHHHDHPMKLPQIVTLFAVLEEIPVDMFVI